jgi:hypothetical protein
MYVCNGGTADAFADDMNAQAIAMMSPSWTFLSAECKSDMKRLACSMIYQPTRDDDDAESLPYRKPCRCELPLWNQQYIMYYALITVIFIA